MPGQGQVKLEGRPLAIFPVRNKKPACRNGFYDAVSDPVAIADLFRRYSGARQIGVATGEYRGNDFDVLDVDPRNGGNAWFEQNRHRLPVTRMHETPSGGLHLLFRHARGLRGSIERIAKGIDVRADGSSVVWWPAQFYPVHDAPVAAWPAWLLELAREKQQRHTVPFPMSDRRGGTPMVWQPSQADTELPKPLYSRVCELTSHTSLRNKRRVLGLLRTLMQKRENRNHALNTIGFAFRELIDAGVITRDAAESLLIDAATLNGYVAKDGLDDAVKTMRSGLGSQTISVPPLLGEEDLAP
jgi:hypothetical protein